MRLDPITASVVRDQRSGIRHQGSETPTAHHRPPTTRPYNPTQSRPKQQTPARASAHPPGQDLHFFQIVKEQPISPGQKTRAKPHRLALLSSDSRSLTAVPCHGGAGRDRTDGLLLAKQALSQLSYSPADVVGLDGFEPSTPALSRRCSNQLSYRPGMTRLHTQTTDRRGHCSTWKGWPSARAGIITDP